MTTTNSIFLQKLSSLMNDHLSEFFIPVLQASFAFQDHSWSSFGHTVPSSTGHFFFFSPRFGAKWISTHFFSLFVLCSVEEQKLHVIQWHCLSHWFNKTYSGPFIPLLYYISSSCFWEHRLVLYRTQHPWFVQFRLYINSVHTAKDIE